MMTQLWHGKAAQTKWIAWIYNLETILRLLPRINYWWIEVNTNLYFLIRATAQRKGESLLYWRWPLSAFFLPHSATSTHFRPPCHLTLSVRKLTACLWVILSTAAFQQTLWLKWLENRSDKIWINGQLIKRASITPLSKDILCLLFANLLCSKSQLSMAFVPLLRRGQWLAAFYCCHGTHSGRIQWPATASPDDTLKPVSQTCLYFFVRWAPMNESISRHALADAFTFALTQTLASSAAAASSLGNLGNWSCLQCKLTFN